MLNSLPKSFADVKTSIKYGHKKLILDDVKSTLRNKSPDLMKENLKNWENFYVRDRLDKREFDLRMEIRWV